MNRKARQVAEREMRRQGIVQIWWSHGQKHEIATCYTDKGRHIDIVFARGHTDDAIVRRIVAKRIKLESEKGIAAPGLRTGAATAST